MWRQPLVGCLSAPGRLQSWAPSSHSPKLRMPQDHRVRRRHSLQLSGSCSKSLHLPRAVRRGRPPPPLERSRASPQTLSTPLPCPKPGQPRGPRGGGWLAKFLQAAGTSSSPRAREHLYATLCPSESALCSVRARAHAHLHAHTHFHASTYTLSAGPKTSCTPSLLGSHCQVDPHELSAALSEVPRSLLLSSQSLPPSPTRTNLWNPCRVPPVTHNACSSHGQHRRPPKVLIFGDPLC